jgi:Fic family protein
VKLEEFQNSTSGRVRRVQGSYYAFFPNPLPPKVEWTAPFVQALSRADRALGELSARGSALPNPYLLVRPFIRREAVLSSRIEGTRANLTDVYTYEAVQLSFFAAGQDVREVHNYVLALDYGIERLHELPVSLRLIRELHERLMAGVRGQEWQPGEFRRSQNWIGPPGSTLQTAVFIPPPVAEMNDALGDLEKFIHQATDLPPLVRLGLIHYQFEAIHPFLDGNGRIGRLLLVLLLADWKLLAQPLLYLSAYFEQHRQAYYDLLLGVSQRGQWVEWLTFFLDGIHSQAVDAVTRVQRLQELRLSYRQEMARKTRSTAVLEVVDLLFARPVITVNQAVQELGLTYAAANRHIGFLVEQGLLEEITGQARNRVYQARGIIAAIEMAL